MMEGVAAKPDRTPGRARVRLGQLLFGLLILAIWEGVTRSALVHPLFLGTPSEILAAGQELIAGGDLTRHLGMTLHELSVGFLLAAAWAIPLGYVLALNPWLDRILDPYIMAFYAVPTAALAPLLILMFGIGPWSKISIAASHGGVPILIATVAGVRNADPVLVQAVRSMGATHLQLFRKVILPDSLPSVVTGLRLGAVICLIGVTVGEMLASQGGLGWLIYQSAGTFQIPHFYVGIIILAFLGMLLNNGIRRIEFHFMRWHYERGGR